MSRMSELDLEIRERMAARQSPVEIAKALGVPSHWVVEIVEENEYNDHFFAENSADADAQAYGTR